METITGVRFVCQPTAAEITRCSELSARFLTVLTGEHRVTFNQILYPYADALSLSGKPGTESTRIFGTHMLLRGIPPRLIESVLNELLPEDDLRYTVTPFAMYDGAAKASDVAAFLRCESTLPGAGEFGNMLSGYVTHWRIRECARVYASFSEMAYRRAKGAISGLLGGRLILSGECDCREAVAAIFTQKTGV